MSRSRQRLITGGGVVVAFLALILATAYQDDTPVEGTAVVGAGTTVSPIPTTAGQGTASTGPAAALNPVERFLPVSGQASACREPVGVDLVPGYGATLTINGISIGPDEMNVARDAQGNVTGQLSASRSLGHYTYGPEEACPNGRVLRATDNLLQACVYRLEEGPATCVVTEYRFSVL